MRGRVALGVELHRQSAAPLLLLTGGGDGAASEAEVMRQLALEAGVPAGALLCEGASRDTAENALYSAHLLCQRGLCRIVLVSHRAHLPRARILFRLAGLRIIATAGVPARSWLRGFGFALGNLAVLPRSVAQVLRRR